MEKTHTGVLVRFHKELNENDLKILHDAITKISRNDPNVVDTFIDNYNPRWGEPVWYIP